jgi:hypothetical protein
MLETNLNSTGVTGQQTIRNNLLPFLPVDRGLSLAGSAGLGLILNLTRG